jgi:hypothetical protein
MPFSAALFRRVRDRLGPQGSLRAFFRSGRITENMSETGASTASAVAIAYGDVATGALRTMPAEKSRQDSRAVGAVLNGVAHGASRGMHTDDSLRAPVVASQEEIVLAEQLRLEFKRKYLNESG